MVPHWGKNAVLNYRAMFKDKYGREYKGTDEKIWEIFNSVFNDGDNKQQDTDRVLKMRDSEDA
jgi:hypothetical protein